MTEEMEFYIQHVGSSVSKLLWKNTPGRHSAEIK